MIAPAMVRIAGVIQLFSNAYFTKKTTPRKSANPPIQANSFTPRIDSQLNGRCGDSGGMIDFGLVGAAGVWVFVTKSGSGGGTETFAGPDLRVAISPPRSNADMPPFSSSM